MSAEMPGDDIEIRDEPREAEEKAEEDADLYSSTGEVFESSTDPDDGALIEVSQTDIELPPAG